MMENRGDDTNLWEGLLDSQPWGTLSVADGDGTTNYFIKSNFSAAAYSFLITDLQSVWIQSCERADIKRLKKVLSPISPVCSGERQLCCSSLLAEVQPAGGHTGCAHPPAHQAFAPGRSDERPARGGQRGHVPPRPNGTPDQ